MSDDKKQIPAVESPEEPPPMRATEAMDDARTRALNEALQSSFKVVRVIMVIWPSHFLALALPRSITTSGRCISGSENI